MSAPEITVVMPAYNARAHIAEAMSSILTNAALRCNYWSSTTVQRTTPRVSPLRLGTRVFV